MNSAHAVSGDAAGFGWNTKRTTRIKASGRSATEEQEATSTQGEEATGRAEQNDSSPNTQERYARAKGNAPSKFHMKSNGKSICFVFQSPSGCSRGETCYHQHVCAQCFGPHSFEQRTQFSESCAANLKKRLGTIRLARSVSVVAPHEEGNKRSCCWCGLGCSAEGQCGHSHTARSFCLHVYFRVLLLLQSQGRRAV